MLQVLNIEYIFTNNHVKYISTVCYEASVEQFSIDDLIDIQFLSFYYEA